MYSDEPYRSCPVCRSKLNKLMNYDEGKKKWKVYQCPNCGSEIYLDEFKLLKEKHGR